MIETEGSTCHTEQEEKKALNTWERILLDDLLLGITVRRCWESGEPAIEELYGQTFIVERLAGKVTVRGIGQKGAGA